MYSASVSPANLRLEQCHHTEFMVIAPAGLVETIQSPDNQSRRDTNAMVSPASPEEPEMNVIQEWVVSDPIWTADF
jgi:hypothetical protein